MNLNATIEKYESTLAYYEKLPDPNPSTTADVRQLIEWLKDYKRLLECERVIEFDEKNSELKPCPFCGTEVKMRKVPLYGYPGCFEFDVRCSKCGCTLDFTRADSLYYSEEEAVANVTKKWNERYTHWFERAKNDD